MLQCSKVFTHTAKATNTLKDSSAQPFSEQRA